MIYNIHMPVTPELQQEELIAAFRVHYYQFEQAVHEATAVLADSTVLARLGDDLDEYSSLISEACSGVFISYSALILSNSMQLFLILQNLHYCRQTLSL